MEYSKQKTESKTLRLLMILGISSIILLIILVLVYPGLPDSGQIGDTIGGMTAPFIGLINAYLVFGAFKTQIRANELQRLSKI
ncbi:MAG: hypothetical protein IM610_16570 [Cytophagales bacterium]|nr:hypothetical protein [Cytophagales bacterium]